MALIARYLIDTSAASRMSHAVVAAQIRPLIDAAIVATCATLDAEALFSARDLTEYAGIRARRRRAYEYLPLEDRHWQAALEAQSRLAVAGRHRAVGVIDLITAILAEEHRITVLHYDRDFEIAADIIPFAHRWVVPRGSVP